MITPHHRSAVPARALRQVRACNGCGGLQETANDWKVWALLILGAILVWMVFTNTPAKQEQKVQIRKARRRYLDEVERIRS